MANARNPYGDGKHLISKLIKHYFGQEAAEKFHEERINEKTEKLSRWLLILIVFSTSLYPLVFARDSD